MSSEAEEGALEISREDLYELVWSKPMLELARDFKISDVGLARRCRRLGIPVPGRGYWARLDAGQKPHRPKLPAREAEPGDESALTVGRLSAPDNVLTVEEDAPSDIQALQEAYERQEPQALLMDAQWLRDRLAFEADAANKIEVTTTGARWHPAIKLHRDCREKDDCVQEGCGALRDLVGGTKGLNDLLGSIGLAPRRRQRRAAR
jgi:hypothetical protein